MDRKGGRRLRSVRRACQYVFNMFLVGRLRPTPELVIEHIAILVTSTVLDWREMLKDEADASWVAQWEREIAWSLDSSCTCELTVIL
jgi:hypothetical protein